MTKSNYYPSDDEHNALHIKKSHRYLVDPWQNNKKIDDADRTAPVPVDMMGREYTNDFCQESNKYYLRRDALIESIIQLDESQIEYIKRLIIEENRLDVLMKLVDYRAPAHQMALNEFFEGRKYGIALAPRGSGKSTSCNICYSVMKALQNRDIRILIASRTYSQAQSFLYEIKSILIHENIRNIFGDLKGEKWDEAEADIAGRKKASKERTFTIAGADGNVVSKHFDIIIGDDLVEEKNSKTELRRTSLKRFFYRSMLPTLRPEGELRILGTRYHPEDLYGHLINNDPSFSDNWFVLPAVFDRVTGETVDFQQDKKGKYYAPVGATCYDPDGFPMSKLLERRSSMPLADFECQYQNRTKFMEGEYFKSDWFIHYDDDPVKLVKNLGLSVWIGVDLASSQKDTADEFAIVVIGILSNMKECYVLDYVAGRYTFNAQKELLLMYYDKWDPVRTYVESNAYQQVLVTTTVEEFPDVRAVPVYTSKDKITRARALQLYYERKQVLHRRGRMSKLEEQLLGFPDMKLKDLFDALFFAINGALQGGARRRRDPSQEPGLF